jgi:hypothetical protein
MIPQVMKLDVEVLGWRGYTCVVVRPLGHAAKFSKTTEKCTFNSVVTALVDIPAVSMPIACTLKTCDNCGTVLCDKTAHFNVAFYCPQHKVHLCNAV